MFKKLFYKFYYKTNLIQMFLKLFQQVAIYIYI